MKSSFTNLTEKFKNINLIPNSEPNIDSSERILSVVAGTIGTELNIQISYFPPVGSVGRGIASLFTGVFEKIIQQDIQNFKRYAEQADFRQYAGLSLEDPLSVS